MPWDGADVPTWKQWRERCHKIAAGRMSTEVLKLAVRMPAWKAVLCAHAERVRASTS